MGEAVKERQAELQEMAYTYFNDKQAKISFSPPKKDEKRNRPQQQRPVLFSLDIFQTQFQINPLGNLL